MPWPPALSRVLPVHAACTVAATFPARTSPHIACALLSTRQLATAFNQPLNLDTSSVEDMSYMFSSASAFNQPLSLDTSSVTDMSYLFDSASAFDQPLSFDTSSVTTMEFMFGVRALAPNVQPSPSLHAACAVSPRPAHRPLTSPGPHPDPAS